VNIRQSGLKSPPAAWVIASLAATLAGCGRNDIQVYKVAKEAAPAPAQMAAAAVLPPGHPDAAGAAPTLEWKLPAGWEEAPLGQMRLASFRVPGKDGKQADVSVVPLPGLAGRDLDNVNRWRGQVGLPAITEEEMAKMAQPIQIDGQAAQLYDQGGQAPGANEKSRILAALMRRGGVAWFFKITGDDELVAQQKPAFVSFLESIKFKEGAPAQAAPEASAQLPPSHPPIGGAMPPAGGPAAMAMAGASSGEKPSWQVPAGWKEVPGGQFLIAKFAIVGDANAQAAVNVSASAGDGGGLAGNVNRWRGQLGLGAVSEADVKQAVTPVDLAGGKAMLVELSGTDARTGRKARLVGAVMTQAGQTWFYKLMGDEAVVEREKPAFTAFLKSVKQPGGADTK